MRCMILFFLFVLASSKEIPFKKILRKCSRVLYYKYCENTSCCDYELATVKIGWTLGIVWARSGFFSSGWDITSSHHRYGSHVSICHSKSDYCVIVYEEKDSCHACMQWEIPVVLCPEDLIRGIFLLRSKKKFWSEKMFPVIITEKVG